MDWSKEIETLEGWSFGNSPQMSDEIAEQTKNGQNSATCSLYLAEKVPKVGDRSYVKDSRNEPVCVVETTRVDIVPFNEVDLEFAQTEGYVSLEEWRDIHISFFETKLSDFREFTLVVCQYFNVIHVF